MFWRKNDNKTINSAEYEQITKRIIKLSGELEELQVKFKILETNYDNLRGQFNRKLSGVKKTEEIAQEEKPQDINTSVILPHNGNFGKFGKEY